MDNETIEGFAKYRLEKAKETLNTAKELIKLVDEYINNRR